MVTGCGGSGSKAPDPSPTPPAPATQPPPPTPAVVEPVQQRPSKEPADPPLTGGPVYLLPTAEKPLWPSPVTVVVENSPQARPQAGLAEADMVVEALAESEITRFLAFYWTTPAEKIGPVRSARTGPVTVARAYKAPLAHAGGNTDALEMTQFQDWSLDEIYGGWQSFYRSDARQPPHNLYTSTQLLDKGVTGRKLELKAAPTTGRAPSLPAPGTAATQAVVTWHKYHQVTWEWRSTEYLRFEDGEPHQLESGRQIAAVNLVFLNLTGVNNGPDLGWTLHLNKGGRATVLSAGYRWEGTWTLADGGFQLTPADSKVPLLAPGPTWVHLITQESDFQVTGKNE